MNTVINKRNPLIREIREEIDGIKGQISSLRYIVNSQKDIEGVNANEIQSEIQTLNDQKTFFKAQLRRAEVEIEKAELENESKKMEDRSSTIILNIETNELKMASLKRGVEDLKNQKKSLELLKKEGCEEVSEDIKKCKKEIKRQKKEIKEIKESNKSLLVSSSENLVKREILKAEIFNLEETTRLKNQLSGCKLALKQLHRNLAGQIVNNDDIEKKEALIKAEMKDIIKGILHSDSFLKIKTELISAKNTLATLEYLKSDGVKISKEEIKEAKRLVKGLESQINAEVKKTDLQKELKEANAELVNLKSCIGVSGIEDVSGAVKETEEKIARLNAGIEKITANSLGIVKSDSKAESKVSQSNTNEVNGTSGASKSWTALVTEELKKWLSENILTQALGADVQEVIVSTALLSLTNANLSPSNGASEVSLSMQSKLQGVATGACEKFCMTQVMQYLITNNPIFSAAYGVSIIASHCILGDGQLSTLIGKVKSFVIGESIKLAGTTFLGGLVTGGVGTLLAIPAGMYLAYNTRLRLSNTTSTTEENDGEETVAQVMNPLPTEDLSAGVWDMIADFTVETMYKKICS